MLRCTFGAKRLKDLPVHYNPVLLTLRKTLPHPNHTTAHQPSACRPAARGVQQGGAGQGTNHPLNTYWRLLLHRRSLGHPRRTVEPRRGRPAPGRPRAQRNTCTWPIEVPPAQQQLDSATHHPHVGTLSFTTSLQRYEALIIYVALDWRHTHLYHRITTTITITANESEDQPTRPLCAPQVNWRVVEARGRAQRLAARYASPARPTHPPLAHLNCNNR